MKNKKPKNITSLKAKNTPHHLHVLVHDQHEGKFYLAGLDKDELHQEEVLLKFTGINKNGKKSAFEVSHVKHVELTNKTNNETYELYLLPVENIAQYHRVFDAVHHANSSTQEALEVFERCKEIAKESNKNAELCMNYAVIIDVLVNKNSRILELIIEPDEQNPLPELYHRLKELSVMKKECLDQFNKEIECEFDETVREKQRRFAERYAPDQRAARLMSLN